MALRDAFVALTGLPGAFALKWPNDVLLNAGKVAGILLEASGPVLAIGIGVNLIAAPPADAVELGATPPVSLLGETGLRITPPAFLAALAPGFTLREAQLRREAQWKPDGAGFARVSIIDAKGATDSVMVRLE